MYSVLNPLDQFEIRNLVEINILNSSIKLTNFMLYVTMSYIIPVFLIEKSLHLLKILATKWSIVQESIYTTIYGMVINQINNHKGQIYFPFIYALFIFILVNNLIGLVPYSFASTSHFILAFWLSFSIVLGATILGFQIHGSEFFSLFVPSGTPLGLVPARDLGNHTSGEKLSNSGNFLKLLIPSFYLKIKVDELITHVR